MLDKIANCKVHLISHAVESAAVATLVKARATTNESDDRSAFSLAFEPGRSRLCEMHSRSCISKVDKERLIEFQDFC